MYNLTRPPGEFVPCTVFGLASIPSRAIGFHVVTDEGAQFARVPIHALAWKPEAPAMALRDLELWDCFSYEVSVTEFEFLADMRCRTRLRNGEICLGRYLFTVDWYGSRLAEDAGDGGHKNAHVIRLDNGCFAAQPNNRIFWHDPSFITRPFKSRPDYVTNTHTWSAERPEYEVPWTTRDPGGEFFYGIDDDVNG